MTIWEAILLGILQGLTEFLPISSTGHLTVAGQLLNLVDESNPQSWTAFIAVVQLGTLGSILIYFWRDILGIIKDFLKENVLERKGYSKQGLNARLGWLIIVGSIPVVIVGLGFKDIIEGELTKNLYVIAGSLIALAVVLAIAEKTARFKKELDNITLWDSLIIGIAQAFALIPGSSRSGTTITGGLFMGLKRDTAARFSFLLSIPAVFGSGMLEFVQELEYLDQSKLLTLAIATVMAGISGYLAIDFLLKFLKKNTTFVFIFYRIILGLIILSLLTTSVINP